MTQDSFVGTWKEGWMNLNQMALHSGGWSAEDLVVPDSVMLGLISALSTQGP